MDGVLVAKGMVLGVSRGAMKSTKSHKHNTHNWPCFLVGCAAKGSTALGCWENLKG